MNFQRNQQAISLALVLPLCGLSSFMVLPSGRAIAAPGSTALPPSTTYGGSDLVNAPSVIPGGDARFNRRSESRRFNGDAVDYSSPIDERDYVLGPGDRVKIEVFKVPQYNLETQVLVDGHISLLQAGRINVQGLTLEEASAVASRKYGKLLRYPVVTVTLMNPRPIRVGIAGEVVRRGSYDLSVGAELNNTAAVQLPTVTRALKVAGGITQSADLRRVQLRRPTASGRDEVYTINLMEYVRGNKPREDVVMRDGDSLFVPTADQMSMAESYEIATTSFSADRVQPLNITVVGEVYRPGTHTVESNVRVEQAGTPGSPRDAFNQTRIYPTITRAIQTAGGIKPMADIRMVQLKRITQSGEEKRFNVDLWKLLSQGDQEQDMIIQDRDTIIIPTAPSLPPEQAKTLAAASFSPDRIRVSVVGEVERPGFIDLPPNTTMNQAILAAGGFNGRADKSAVEFVRVNPNGTVVQKNMPVNIALGIDEEKNPPLRNEDVIVVKRSGYDKTVRGAGELFGPLGAIVGVFRAIFGF
jgi:polysaccharide export outer membrane protein